MTVCQLQADPSVSWISDSYDSFDVRLAGTGPGWTGTITSPSGLWQLYSANTLQYPFSLELPLAMIGNGGRATFLGPLPAPLPAPDPLSINSTVSIGTPGGYMQFSDPVAPISGANPMNYGYLSTLSFYGAYSDWGGMSTFSITSIPDVNDLSTWTWQAEYAASGENMGITPAPEPNAISLVILTALMGVAVRACRKRRPAMLPIRLVPSRPRLRRRDRL